MTFSGNFRAFHSGYGSGFQKFEEAFKEVLGIFQQDFRAYQRTKAFQYNLLGFKWLSRKFKKFQRGFKAFQVAQEI